MGKQGKDGDSTRILVVVPGTEEQYSRLRQAAPGARFRFTLSPTEEKIGEAAVIVGNPPPALLRKAASLRLLQLETAGANPYLGDVLPPEVPLCNAAGAYGPAIAEHLLAMLLSLYKKLPAYGENRRAALWRDEGTVRTVEGSTTLGVGLGDIGGQFARLLHALGGRVLGIKRTPGDCPEYLEGLYPPEALDGLLPAADAVALCLPSTPKTRGLFSRERLERMKDGAVLLNVGRGDAVDTGALDACLRSGKLGGAGLDVTDPEPLPPEHPLWGAPGLLITPHVSGGHHAAGTVDRIFQIAADNLRALWEGRPLTHRVDRREGY